MIMNTGFHVLGLLLMATGAALAELRTWTFEQSGSTMRAEVVGFTGDTVSLRRDDGHIVSVRTSYFVEKDRAYLNSKRAKQWKAVEIISLDGLTSSGLYKKCTVSGGGLKGEVLIKDIPPSVETVLNGRSQYTAQISNLTAQVESDKAALDDANATAPPKVSGNRAVRRVNSIQRAPVTKASGDLKLSQMKLAEAQKSFQQSVKNTSLQTTIKMRNTGLVYQNLQVWECADPRRPTD
jgi:hypothetical protein